MSEGVESVPAIKENRPLIDVVNIPEENREIFSSLVSMVGKALEHDAQRAGDNDSPASPKRTPYFTRTTEPTAGMKHEDFKTNGKFDDSKFFGYVLGNGDSFVSTRNGWSKLNAPSIIGEFDPTTNKPRLSVQSNSDAETAFNHTVLPGVDRVDFTSDGVVTATTNHREKRPLSHEERKQLNLLFKFMEEKVDAIESPSSQEYFNNHYFNASDTLSFTGLMSNINEYFKQKSPPKQHFLKKLVNRSK